MNNNILSPSLLAADFSRLGEELAVLKAAEEGRIPMSEEEKNAFFKDFLYGPYAGVKDYDTPAPWIGNWPEMADSFIKRTLH